MHLLSWIELIWSKSKVIQLLQVNSNDDSTSWDTDFLLDRRKLKCVPRAVKYLPPPKKKNHLLGLLESTTSIPHWFPLPSAANTTNLPWWAMLKSKLLQEGVLSTGSELTTYGLPFSPRASRIWSHGIFNSSEITFLIMSRPAWGKKKTLSINGEKQSKTNGWSWWYHIIK